MAFIDDRNNKHYGTHPWSMKETLAQAFMIDQESSKAYTPLPWGIGVIISNFEKNP